ncbi:GPI2-domain-containing protein [Violaceomyces palustris]|uniref:GPI2-domain-containing protein n=1 Tax=Violaceomyces palustris TaxID=1673888 RepID=A0ACD0NY94_9BASI|nr:GPI2-domain-containing protein [Violaceomyces palustris]
MSATFPFRADPPSPPRSSQDRIEPTLSRLDKPKWEKLLWKKQPFPDNHVPDSFLDKLKTNTTTRLPSFSTIAISSLPISQQFVSILFFSGVFVYLRSGDLAPETLILVGSSLSLAGWLIMDLLDHQLDHHHHQRQRREIPQNRFKPDQRGGGKTDHRRVYSDRQRRTRWQSRSHAATKVGSILSFLILSLVLLALSPVLKTLTEATTSDSIWALSSALFVLNFALADYSSPLIVSGSRVVDQVAQDASYSDGGGLVTGKGKSTKLDIVSEWEGGGEPMYGTVRKSKSRFGGEQGPEAFYSTLSLNAAISSSVVLASRLESDLQVFALVLFAIQTFAFLPIFTRRLRSKVLIERVGCSGGGIEGDDDGRGGVVVKGGKGDGERREEAWSLFPCSLTLGKRRKKREDPVTDKESEGGKGRRKGTGTTTNREEWPAWTRRRRRRQRSSNVTLSDLGSLSSTLTLLGATMALLWPLNPICSIICLCGSCFISVVCPAWMRWAQRWKNEIKGPWDPAEPILGKRSSLSSFG